MSVTGLSSFQTGYLNLGFPHPSPAAKPHGLSKNVASRLLTGMNCRDCIPDFQKVIFWTQFKELVLSLDALHNLGALVV